MFLSLAILNATAYACEEPLKLEEVNQYLEQSTSALKSMDAKQASLLIKSIGNTINCLNEPVTPEFASSYFLMQGILLWASDKQDDSLRYFDAAKSIAPDIKISTDIFPQTHEIHVFFKVAPKSSDQVELKPAKNEVFYFDGVEGIQRPENRPTIFQRSLEGLVVTTDIIDKGEAVPDVVEVASSGNNTTEPVVVNKGSKNTLLWVSVATGTVAAGFGTMATLSHMEASKLEEEGTAVPDDLRSENNLYFVMASASGVTSAVTGLLWLRQRSK